jgi:hypothetical protein
MKVFSIQFLLLSSLFFGIACSPIHGFHKVQVENINSILGKSVIDSTTQKTVYKTKITIYDNYFSGLFLIKFVPKDTSFRVVFLSEVGLNLLDFKYKNNKFTVVSCQDFLNKKMILETLQNDFLLLFSKIDRNKNCKVYQKETDSIQVIKFRDNWKKFYYFCGNQKEFFRIHKKSFFYGSVDVLIHYDQELKIDEMNFKHKGIKLEMNLIRLNKDE